MLNMTLGVILSDRPDRRPGMTSKDMDSMVRMTYKFSHKLDLRPIRAALLSVVCIGLASCGTTTAMNQSSKRSKEYFPESKYGVKASPRVASGAAIPKGGGRYMVGKPYQVAGKWYYPKEDFGYNKVGFASWYGSAFHGRKTANGEVYDQQTISAAHPTFPLPSYARVTNLENGSSVIVRVNDRGPYDSNRVIDLSNKTAELLDMKRKGTAKVRVQYVGKARMDGHDMPYLMASYVPKGGRIPAFDPGNNIATGVMVASNDKNFAPASDPVPVSANNNSAEQGKLKIPAYKPSQQLALNEDVDPITPNALTKVASQPAAFDAAMQMFPQLPSFGPVPPERPATMELASVRSISAVAAYAQERVETSARPFDAVLHSSKTLTPDAILSSFHNRTKIK